MTFEQLKLDNQLCFPLYACSRQITRLYTPVLEPLGLTYTQYITLLVLWEKDNLTVKELGDRLFLDSGTLTPLLKKLEAQGLIKRKRSVNDERSVIVTLTTEGFALKEIAATIPDKIASCVNLPTKDAEELYRILYLMLSRQNGGSESCSNEI